LIGTGIASWQSANAAKAVVSAEKIAEQHLKVARQLDHGIKSMDIHLDMLKKENKGLVSLRQRSVDWKI
jgi:hypothetical protein